MCRASFRWVCSWRSRGPIWSSITKSFSGTSIRGLLVWIHALFKSHPLSVTIWPISTRYSLQSSNWLSSEWNLAFSRFVYVSSCLLHVVPYFQENVKYGLVFGTVTDIILYPLIYETTANGSTTVSVMNKYFQVNFRLWYFRSRVKRK